MGGGWGRWIDTGLGMRARTSIWDKSRGLHLGDDLREVVEFRKTQADMV